MLEDGDEAGAAEAFFDFRVGDLAMGSGHFLVAAVDHIEAGMAAFLVEHHLPEIVNELRRLEGSARDALGDAQADYEIEPSALLRRQIARRCVYGIDLNPIAVELARVAMWIHTFVAGLPMSSLDHTLVCANSITGVGSIDEALESLETDRRAGMPSLFSMEIEQALEDAKKVLVNAANTSEATKAEVRSAVEAAAEAAERAAPTKLLFDAAVALRIGVLPEIPGQGAAELQKQVLRPEISDQLNGLQAAHMPFLFPEVFLRENGGFDVLIGNPPWEEVKIDAWRWWALRSPGLMGLKASQREAAISGLAVDRPDLQSALEDEIEIVGAMRHIIRSGPYPGIGTGDIDLYKAFAWRNWQLLRDGGSIGIVLPRSALAAAGTVEWRKSVLASGTFEDVCFLTNTNGWVFADIDQRYTVTLTVALKGRRDLVAFSGPFHSYDEFVVGRSERGEAPKEEFRTWTDSLSFPRVPDRHAGQILRKMKHHPRFDSSDGFEFKPVRELDMTNDRSKFETDLTRRGLAMPVLTGASFGIWNPDFGDPYGRADPKKLVPHLLQKAKKGTRHSRSAFYGLTVDAPEDHPISTARIAFRSITNSTNQRTAVFSLVPPHVGLVNAAPYLLRRTGTERDEALLLGVASSIPFDWYSRRWVEVNMNFYLLSPMPIPRPDPNSAIRQRVVEQAGRLAAVDDRYGEWASEVGVSVGSLNREPERSEAIAELDALVALLYGLDWVEVQHVFETFHRGWDYSDRLERVAVHFENWSNVE